MRCGGWCVLVFASVCVGASRRRPVRRSVGRPRKRRASELESATATATSTSTSTSTSTLAAVQERVRDRDRARETKMEEEAVIDEADDSEDINVESEDDERMEVNKRRRKCRRAAQCDGQQAKSRTGAESMCARELISLLVLCFVC